MDGGKEMMEAFGLQVIYCFVNIVRYQPERKKQEQQQQQQQQTQRTCQDLINEQQINSERRREREREKERKREREAGRQVNHLHIRGLQLLNIEQDDIKKVDPFLQY